MKPGGKIKNSNQCNNEKLKNLTALIVNVVKRYHTPVPYTSA